jgi:ATP-binding cassette, subfamily B, bacterial PglK
MTTVRQLMALLTPAERRRGFFVLLAAVGMAVVDTLGVASVMPFLAVLGNPEIIESNAWVQALYSHGGFTNRDEFLFALGLVALAVVLTAALVRAAGQYAILHFVNMRRYSLSQRLLTGYLGQPYAFFLNRNSADLSKRVLSDVDIVIDHCLNPLVQMTAHGLIMTLLMVLLFAVDPALAGTVLAIIGGFYAAVYFGARHLISRSGRDRNLANRERFTAAAEAFGGIKEMKLFGREQYFSERFAGPAMRFARHKTTADTISLLPRYLIEAVAFGGALALALVLIGTRGDLGAVLPILGLYAFAGYRMMPAAQAIYSGLTRLRFYFPIVSAMLQDMPPFSVARVEVQPDHSIDLRQGICFDHVGYSYPGAARPSLSGLDFEIPAGSTIGFVGPTGAGKTTAVDLVLGLLVPSEGRILIDGEPLSDANRRAWQRGIGYVPQSIYLADVSVAENIAFGVLPAAIDRDAVERAAKIANIHGFIMEELAKGYDTVIGERGVRLSGGQRQRIGIARALYHDPSLLVFDEATSALDNATETAVMDAISCLQGDKTIIIIAHRLSTVRGCDQIVLLEHGEVKAAGTFNELTEVNNRFRAIAGNAERSST